MTAPSASVGMEAGDCGILTLCRTCSLKSGPAPPWWESSLCRSMPGVEPTAPRFPSVLRQRSQKLRLGSTGNSKLGPSPTGLAASGFSTGQLPQLQRLSTRRAGPALNVRRVSAPGTAACPCAPGTGALRSSPLSPLSRDSRMLEGTQDFTLAGGP